MRVAVLSDIHDNIWNLEAALHDIAGRGGDVLLFLGDFCAPFTLAQMAEGFRGPIHAVFGNNDGDPFLLAQVASKFDHVHLYGPFAELELAGRRVALNHYPEIARRLVESGAYDAVFSGHNHQRHLDVVGTTLWANPGEVMGRFGAPSYGLYDPANHVFEHVDIRRE
ncbi:MAG: YfcE family phosphodiesterase [Ardenticatenia bacterium]|nr:YfcE family phosphodiesterase [Ardenticatenia bacterium]